MTKKYNFIRLFFVIITITISHLVFAQPANDNPCGAIELFPGLTCSYGLQTNVGATNTASPFSAISINTVTPSIVFVSNVDVWFKVVVPSNGILIIDTEVGSLTDANMVIYSGTTCGGPFTLLNANNDTRMSPTTLNNMPIIAQNNLTPGSTLWIRIGATNLTGTFGICVTSPSDLPTTVSNPAASDDCESSQPICNLNGYSGTTVGYAPTDSWTELVDALPPLTVLQNDSYINITAASTSISFDIWMTSSKLGQ